MLDISQRIEVKVRYMEEAEAEEFAPAYATTHSAGLDLRARVAPEGVDIPPGGRHGVPTGISIEVCTPGVAGFIFSRSGLGAVRGLTVGQGVGVIDPDYRGEIIVFLLNTSGEPRRVERGDRIAQLVFLPVFTADILAAEELTETARGAGGFGHTGGN